MSDSRYTLRIEREDGELLVVDGLALVRAFIEGDPSAQPGGYDSVAGKGDPARITRADVTAINQTMRARSGHKYWTQTYNDPQEGSQRSDLNSISSRPTIRIGRPRGEMILYPTPLQAAYNPALASRARRKCSTSSARDCSQSSTAWLCK